MSRCLSKHIIQHVWKICTYRPWIHATSKAGMAILNPALKILFATIERVFLAFGRWWELVLWVLHNWNKLKVSIGLVDLLAAHNENLHCTVLLMCDIAWHSRWLILGQPVNNVFCNLVQSHTLDDVWLGSSVLLAFLKATQTAQKPREEWQIIGIQTDTVHGDTVASNGMSMVMNDCEMVHAHISQLSFTAVITCSQIGENWGLQCWHVISPISFPKITL